MEMNFWPTCNTCHLKVGLDEIECPRCGGLCELKGDE